MFQCYPSQIIPTWHLIYICIIYTGMFLYIAATFAAFKGRKGFFLWACGVKVCRGSTLDHDRLGSFSELQLVEG